MSDKQLASRKRAIRAACNELGIDDATRKEIMREKAAVSSSTELDMAGANKVLDHLRACGATKKPPRKHGNRPHNYDRLPEYITKVEALLADMGLSWEYADSIARNITGGKGAPELDKAPGVEKLAWVKKAEHWRAIIAALSKEQEKRDKHGTILRLLGELGKDTSYVEELLLDSGNNHDNWHRKRNLMGRIIMFLEAEAENEL